MDTPIKSFCDQVSIKGQLDLQKCGINANNLFFCNYSVAPTPTENRRLLIEMGKHPVLFHLTNRTIVTRQDVTPYYSPVPQAGYPPQAAGYSHGYTTPHAGFGVPAYPPAVSNPAPHAGFGGSTYPSPVFTPAPHAGFGVPAYPSAMSAPAPQTGLYPTLIPTPATGSRFSASSSAGTFSTTPGAVGGTGSAYTGSAVAFTPFSSGSTTPLLPSAARPVSRAVDDVKVLPGRVKLVTSSQGIDKFIKRKNSEKSYGVVNSIDESGQLQRGVANTIKNIAGNNYARVILDRQRSAKLSDRVGYGQCFTYDCNLNRWSKPSGLNNWQTIHNVLVPFSIDAKFEAHLKNTLLKVFNEAAHYGIDRVILPLLGCGQAGGTGSQLAEAISAAKRAFESSARGRKAPEMILVATSSTADKKASSAFVSKWNSLSVATPAPFSASSGTAARTATTKAGSVYNTSRVLIRDQLEVVMNSDKGMFGYAKMLSSQGMAFDLVNAANEDMDHTGGIAKQFSDDLGDSFNRDTKRQAQQNPNGCIPTGQCITSNPYGYATYQRFGLTNCRHIHSVVAPIKGSTPQYDQKFKEAFVSLLLAAQSGGNAIVSCFIGCDGFGGSGYDMAHALHAAYQDSRITSLSKVPKLILAGWKDNDWQVHEEFIQTFESLKIANPVHLPSGITPARPLSTGISGTTLPARSDVIRKTPSSYSPSGAGLSSRSRHASPVASPLSTSSGSPLSVRRDTGWTRLDTASDKVVPNAQPLKLKNVNNRVHAPKFSAESAFTRKTPSSPMADRAFTPMAAGSRLDRSGSKSMGSLTADSLFDNPDSTRLSASPEPAVSSARSSSGYAMRDSTRSAVSNYDSTFSASSATAASTATTKVGSSSNTSSVLIPDQLEVGMSSDGGMFGCGRMLSSQGEKFDLVNAANGFMAHGAGVARQFAEDLKSSFVNDTQQLAQQFPGGKVPAGECITTGPHGYATNQSFGLTNCQHIHNVVAPMKSKNVTPQKYDQLFKEAFVSLLLASHETGGNTIVCCFIGCSIFGGDGNGMAKALHAAYQDPRIKSLSKVPKLILTGYPGGKSDDRTTHDEFIQTFDLLNSHNPIRLPSARPLSTGISGTTLPGGSGAIRRTPSFYSPSGEEGLSSRSRPASPVTSPLNISRSGSPLSVSSDEGWARFDAASDGVVPNAQALTLKNVNNNFYKVHEPNGVRGFAKARFGNSAPFFFVNAGVEISGGGTNDHMTTDVASGAGKDGGRFFEDMMRDKKERLNLKGEGYYQSGPFGYSQSPDLQGCQGIHNIVFPDMNNDSQLGDTVRQFVRLLRESSASDVLLLSLDHFTGATDANLAKALDEALDDDEIAERAKSRDLPTLYFVDRKAAPSLMADRASRPMAAGYRLDRSHSKSMHSLFDNTGSTRRSASPEPVAPSAMTSSRYGMWDSARSSDRDDIFSSSTEKKYSMTSGVSKPTESATIAFKGGGKTIDCGICGESKPEKDFQQVKGLEVCSDCSEGYQNQGVSLSEAAKLGEEYTAINYMPLSVSRDRRDLPGYPGAGRIIVSVDATAPHSLSDGRILDVTNKYELHYLPDNAVGKELLRLLEVLHQEKLIYKIDKSNTTGKFGITFNFHLKTSDSGGVRRYGYPDTTYPGRALNEIAGLASTHSLQDKLDTSKLVDMVFG